MKTTVKLSVEYWKIATEEDKYENEFDTIKLRKCILITILKISEPLYIDIDGIPEFSQRFRKQAFTALVSVDGFTPSFILEMFEFISVIGQFHIA